MPPLNGSRGAAVETSANVAVAIGRRSALAVHVVRDSGPVRRCSRVKSHSPFGIAQSARPPSREGAESTQMSVTSTPRPRPGSSRRTSSSEQVSGLPGS